MPNNAKKLTQQCKKIPNSAKNLPNNAENACQDPSHWSRFRICAGLDLALTMRADHLEQKLQTVRRPFINHVTGANPTKSFTQIKNLTKRLMNLVYVS